MTKSRLAPLVLLALLATSCEAPPESETKPELPPGVSLLVKGLDLQSLLSQLQKFEGSPLAQLAEEARSRTRHCKGKVTGWSASLELSEVMASLQCEEASSHDPKHLDTIRSLQGTSSLILTTEIKELGHGILTSDIGPSGSIHGTLSVPLPEPDSAWSILIPSPQPPGPPALDSSAALLYGRFRSDGGLRPGAFVQSGSQGDRLMGLRSELFSGLLFDGTWEFAFYPPGPGELLLPWAVAVGVRSRKAAVAGVEGWIEDLAQRWPLTRSLRQGDGVDGVCLRDLNVLPDLAPCYHASETALIFASNDRALDLTADPDRAPHRSLDASTPTGFITRFDRFPPADESLRKSRDAERDSVPTTYPYSRLEIQPTREARRLVFNLEAVATERRGEMAP
ncbi:MAG TPA: hypothetical protein DIU15_16090 [Deltaproteobacteria bacterium]|nr:hypothetical protein [Deltaproteobacteria bacterium]HCP47562.1 hypothetical protein [Deltaproteobacteria bacterium]